VLPTCARYGMGVIPYSPLAGGWLSGRYRKDSDPAGLTLIELAIAFVLRHPAVTAAIIGPRTMEHLESQLTAADVHLSDDVLDQIDAIVPPGVTLNPADNGWVSPALEPAARRR
jgi:aryl-alcohol dehydrogenase-like predicted oxidoreductase